MTTDSSVYSRKYQGQRREGGAIQGPHGAA